MGSHSHGLRILPTEDKFLDKYPRDILVIWDYVHRGCIGSTQTWKKLCTFSQPYKKLNNTSTRRSKVCQVLNYLHN